MNYKLILAEHLIKVFDKLSKKDKKQLKQVHKKIQEILKNPYHFKPLRGDMKGSRRIHVGSFVLTYEVLDDKKVVRILDYDHHDKIY